MPSREIDAEPLFAASVLRRSNWLPLGRARGLELGELRELQERAVGEANAALGSDGRLEPLQP